MSLVAFIGKAKRSDTHQFTQRKLLFEMGVVTAAAKYNCKGCVLRERYTLDVSKTVDQKT